MKKIILGILLTIGLAVSASGFFGDTDQITVTAGENLYKGSLVMLGSNGKALQLTNGHLLGISENTTNSGSTARIRLVKGLQGVKATISNGIVGTPGTLANAGYENKSCDLTLANATTPHGVRSKPDGTRMYVSDLVDNGIYQFSLDIPWNLDTARSEATSQTPSLSTSSQGTSPVDFAFTANGKQVFVVDDSSNTVYRYNLSTAWDLSTGSYASVSKSFSGYDIRSIAFSSNGKRLYLGDQTTDDLLEIPLATAYVITSNGAPIRLTLNGSVSTNNITTFDFLGNGSVFIVGKSSDPATLYEYSLTTPWSISTATYTNRSYVVRQFTTNAYGICISPDGNKLYVTDPTAYKIKQFSLGGAFLKPGQKFSIRGKQAGYAISTTEVLLNEQ